jgi:hypothetical protein
MNESSKHISFSVADIERYYKGQMSAAERHALEKAALDDPFLADALEGYAFTATPVEDVETIKERLEEKQTHKQSVPVLKKYQWLQIAALFLLLAGSGWLVYHFGLSAKKEIAITQPTQKQTAPAPAIRTQHDSSNLFTSQSVKAEEHTKQTTQSVSGKQVAKHSPKQKAEAEKAATDSQETDLNAVASAPAINKNEFPNLKTYKRSFINRNTDSSKDRFLTAESLENNNKVTASVNKAVIPIPDSLKSLAASARRNQPSGDTVPMNVTLQPSKEALNEVVVTGYGKKKASAKQNITFGTLEPAQGWTNFDDYIAQNLKEPEEIKEKILSGDVELSFDVNKEGEAVNIKVEKSLCGKCDEEAVRLLKEGPKWKKSRNKRGRVTIHF